VNPRRRGTSRGLIAFVLAAAGTMSLSAREPELLRNDISALILSTT